MHPQASLLLFLSFPSPLLLPFLPLVYYPKHISVTIANHPHEQPYQSPKITYVDLIFSQSSFASPPRHLSHLNSILIPHLLSNISSPQPYHLISSPPLPLLPPSNETKLLDLVESSLCVAWAAWHESRDGPVLHKDKSGAPRKIGHPVNSGWPLQHLEPRGKRSLRQVPAKV